MGDRSEQQAVGVVRDYFRKIGVAALEVIQGSIKVGDTLRFRGHTTDFLQVVDSMQINHQDVLEAVTGDLVAVRVEERVRENDKVFIESGRLEADL